MPRGDRSGPNGMGSMTGRRMGYCADFNNPNFAQQGGFGYGYGGGFRGGFGRGFRRRYGFEGEFSSSDLSEKKVIENEINILKNQLTFLEKQLSATENNDDKS